MEVGTEELGNEVSVTKISDEFVPFTNAVATDISSRGEMKMSLRLITCK